MRKGMRWIVGICFVATAPLAAQSLPPVSDVKSEPRSPAVAALMPPVVDCSCPPNSCENFRFWARGEYLLWWVKNAPLPVPLVTTGDPNTGLRAGVNIAGAIGQPGTQVLVGNNSENLGAFSGMRFTLGGWLDNEQRLGIEAS